ncbi:MIP/aquaporin family protein [Nocardioides sp. 1609]|uniref:MIP/aquaporin family protein n=1 Tax=Nocardioides sp. 1609 TaxID=2508327 RepID=UPI001FD722D4|nr:MIP/aquaporin family protein [Nocardioides sp. 1609]
MPTTGTREENTAVSTKKNTLVGELSAEFAGTLILILFGCGVVASVVAAGRGDADSISWAWGLGVVLGIYTAGKITGAHLNPAVTIALAAFRGFPWSKVGPYALAQLAGAFVAAIIVRFTYADFIKAIDPDLGKASMGIFFTSPGATPDGEAVVSITTAFADQLLGTAILVFLVLALTTATNAPPMANLTPWFVGMIVVAIGMAWGANAGYAINPARDLGPRLAAWMTGYGNDVWEAAGSNDVYFWVPIVAPVIGGLIGGVAFKYLIEIHLPAEEPETAGEKGVQA